MNMQMGVVVGRVTATKKDENLVGTKLLITQPIGIDGNMLSNPIITVDTVGAVTRPTTTPICIFIVPLFKHKCNIQPQ